MWHGLTVIGDVCVTSALAQLTDIMPVFYSLDHASTPFCKESDESSPACRRAYAHSVFGLRPPVRLTCVPTMQSLVCFCFVSLNYNSANDHRVS